MGASGALLDAIARGPQFQVQAQTPQDIALKNAQIGVAQQNIQGQALENQQRTLDMQDSALTRVYVQKHNGSVIDALNDPELQSQIQPKTAIAFQQGIIANQDKLADVAQKHAKATQDMAAAQKSQAEMEADQAYALQQGGYNAAATEAAVHQWVNHGLMDPQTAQSVLQRIQDPAMLRQTIDQLAMQSPRRIDDIKAQAAAKEAETRGVVAQTGANRLAAELPGIQAGTQEKVLKNTESQRQQDAQMLAAASQQGMDAYRQALETLPYGRAKLFEGATSPQDILKRGLSPEQNITTSETAARDIANQAHQKVEEKQGAQRVGIDAARLGLEKEKAGFDMSGGVSPAAQMLADGRMDPATARSMLRRMPGLMAQVQQIDPQFDEANLDKRYNTLKEFTNTSNTKAGGQALALNTLIHHADLYLETADALKNGTFKPGNAAYNAVASAFGSAPPAQADLVARFLAGETGKVATGGVPAEGEIKGILNNLSSSNSPEQIRGAAQSLLQVAAGRAVPLQEKVADAKLDKVVQVLGPDAKAILQKRGFDPNTMKPVAQATAAKPMTGTQKSTGNPVYSTDGGKTWQPGKPPGQ